MIFNPKFHKPCHKSVKNTNTLFKNKMTGYSMADTYVYICANSTHTQH